jgi:hypothetical protein
MSKIEKDDVNEIVALHNREYSRRKIIQGVLLSPVCFVLTLAIVAGFIVSFALTDR